MKYCKILLLFIITIIGCEKEYYHEFVISNQTSHLIRIEGYDRINIANNGFNDNFQNTLELISINPNQNYSVLRARGYQSDPFGVFENMGIDSVNIYFDEKKVIFQTCKEYTTLRSCNLNRNIVGYETDYEKIKTGRNSGENEYRFTYTITEDDYNNAIQIRE